MLIWTVSMGLKRHLEMYVRTSKEATRRERNQSKTATVKFGGPVRPTMSLLSPEKSAQTKLLLRSEEEEEEEEDDDDDDDDGGSASLVPPSSQQRLSTLKKYSLSEEIRLQLAESECEPS